MRFHSPACVALMRRLCDQHGLLLILDEIATGFGRTGAMFACEHAGVSPDIMCVGKALTGGYMTLAATLCTSAVAEAISTGEGGALMHGPTYMASPLACSVALASLDLLSEAPGGRCGGDRAGLRKGLAPARDLPGVPTSGSLARSASCSSARGDVCGHRRGGRARSLAAPFRDLIYTMPPYVIGEEELASVSAAVVAGAGASISR